MRHGGANVRAWGYQLIDECFLGVKGSVEDLLALGRTMKGARSASQAADRVRGDLVLQSQRQTFPSVNVPSPIPTADPVILTKAAHALLPRIVEGVKYARAGIMVTDLRPSGNQKPLELFEASGPYSRTSARSTAGVQLGSGTRASREARTEP